VRSQATSIAEYLDEVEDRWTDVARAVVAICDDELSGAGIRYGMPCWSPGEVAELAVAVQRRHLSVYVMRWRCSTPIGTSSMGARWARAASGSPRRPRST